jgi:23S rRNA pseudouridine1911/1915/1917 synthase
LFTYPPIEFTVPAPWDGRSIQSILRSELDFSRTAIRRLKRGPFVLKNHVPAALWEPVRAGDQITITIETEGPKLPGDDLPLDICYEDADLVVVNKAPGMVVHPTKGHVRGTLANALVHHWNSRGESAGFHPVHRLDRWTSGLLVIAKSPWAHQQLDIALQKHRLVREYLAIVAGRLAYDSGVITAPIRLTEDQLHRGVAREGQAARTRYRTLKRWDDASLVFCRLFTGRTHQIRVHLAYMGHPILGDVFYGNEDPRIDRPALHACRLRLPHPRTREVLSFTCPLPEDMQRALALATSGKNLDNE